MQQARVNGSGNRAWFRLSSISSRLIVIIVALVLVPTSINVAVTAYNDIENGREQSLNQLDSVATLKQAQVNGWINSRHEELGIEVNDRTLSLIPFVLPDSGFSRVQEDSVSRLRELFVESIDSQSAFDEIFLMSLGGRILVSTDEGNEGSSLEDKVAVLEAADGEYIGPLLAGTPESATQVLFMQPVFERGEKIAIIGGRAGIEELNAIMEERAGLGDTGETYLVDASYNLVTPSRFAGYDVGVTEVSTEAIDTAIADNESGSGEYQGYRDETVFGIYRWIPELGVVLVAERGQAEALNSTLVTLRVGIAVAVAAIGVAVVVGLFFVRTISKPLTELTSAATRITAGDLEILAPIERNDEIGVLSTAFATMTTRLSELINTLEDRVAARTRDLELAAEVSRVATSVMDHEVLLPQVADLTREAFDLYHVSIFVLDETQSVLRLEAGTGAAGDSMKQRNKRFNIDGVGLVPKAARERQAVVVNNTTDSDEYFQNPLLPNTRAEIALPMIVGDKLIGVLDLQSEEIEHFTSDDLRVLQTLADRIAVSIRNAQLYTDSQKAKEHAEQSDKVKSMFLASMSHELRTPLNAIINFSQFIALEMFGDINKRQRETIMSVIESAEHLLTLINDVLDISKIESGSLKLFVENEIDLHEVTDVAVTTARSLLSEKDVELRVSVEDDLPLISGDRQRITQIMLNILSNACKFTKEGRITIDVRRAGESVKVSISDTGPGIAPEDFDNVFEKFKQTSTGLRQGGGTGLGMPITKSLIEAHGGELHLESVVNEGTTVVFTLPVENAALVEVEVI